MCIRDRSKPFFELEKLPKQPIPNIIHFVHMGFKPFMYYQYLAVSIAKQVNPDAQIFMYYSQEPPGDLTWWNRVKELVTLEQMSIPLDSTPEHVRKKAYTLSIIKVIEKGGVYLGTNVFCIRSFSKLYKIDTNTNKTLSSSINKMLVELQDKPEKKTIENLTIRAMAKAKYTTKIDLTELI